jgi:copper chaperone CopZ
MMKKIMFLMAMMLMSVVSFAQNYKTLVVSVTPQMRCENCEKKVQNGLKAVAGVDEVKTCLKSQTVAVKYDSQKTGDGKIVKALKKMGYKAQKAGKGTKKCCKPDCKKMSADCCNNKKAKDCCETTKTCCMEKSGCGKEMKGCDKQMAGCDKAKKAGCDKQMAGCDKAKKAGCDKAMKAGCDKQMAGCDKAKKDCQQGAKADCCKEKK